jgi:hypothetical protein
MLSSITRLTATRKKNIAARNPTRIERQIR